jgi:drug/metabolite transporter (DMT)-like permease
VAILLGLAVAAAYGSADFLGGLTSKRSAVMSVMLMAQAVGVTVLALVMALGPGAAPTARDHLLGVAVGVTGSVAVAFLYRGLAVGRMSVVAPITAVGSAVLPVAWGVAASGERPSSVVAAGVVLAVVAVVLVARAHAGTVRPSASPRQELGMAAAAGTGFGALFILLSETGDDAGLWPVAVARCTSVAILAVVAVVTGRALLPDVADRRLVALSGVLDIAANSLFLLASRAGLLSVVAALAALYPAGTVLLARLVLDERLSRTQTVGLGVGAAAVVLIATG